MNGGVGILEDTLLVRAENVRQTPAHKYTHALNTQNLTHSHTQTHTDADTHTQTCIHSHTYLGCEWFAPFQISSIYMIQHPEIRSPFCWHFLDMRSKVPCPQSMMKQKWKLNWRENFMPIPPNVVRKKCYPAIWQKIDKKLSWSNFPLYGRSYVR